MGFSCVIFHLVAISTIEFNKEGTHFAYGNADGIVSVVEMGLAVSIFRIANYFPSIFKPTKVHLTNVSLLLVNREGVLLSGLAREY